jgi:hypothetical protein
MRTTRFGREADMGRSSGDALGPFRSRNRGAPEVRDPLARTLHSLGNNIHSLALRLYVLQKSDLGGESKSHVNAANRLATQSLRLLEEVQEMVELVRASPRSGTTVRANTAPRRSSRK